MVAICSLLILSLLQDFAHSQSCTCDLTANFCDTNCCCDAECSNVDKLAFNGCTKVDENRLSEVCVSDNVLFSADGEYQLQGSGGGLFCVYQDNYQERSFYTTIASINSSAEFESLALKYHRASYIVADGYTRVYQDSFKNGDTMFVLLTSGEPGYLAQPINGETCSYTTPAKFLTTGATSCVIHVRDLKEQCTFDVQWNAQAYLNTYKIAPYPSFIFGTTRFMEGTNASQVMPTFVDAELITPQLLLPIKCQTPDGEIVNCNFNKLPKPTFNEASKTCENVFSKITYDVTYSSNETVVIKSVQFRFELRNIQPEVEAIEHTFQYQYMSDVETNKTAIRRSGRPGYVRGLPVISGNLVPHNDSERSTIQISKIGLSMMMPSKSSLCSSGLERMTLTFGVDRWGACFVSMTNGMGASQCSSLQKEIFGFLTANQPSHVASFGDLDGSTTDEWVSVLYQPPTAKVTTTNGQCQNMITGVTYEILYAKTGYYANPQNKIVGVEIKYDKPKTLAFRCLGLLCNSSRSQKVMVTHTVKFVDVSATPRAEVRPIPSFTTKAPNDFFYPFF